LGCPDPPSPSTGLAPLLPLVEPLVPLPAAREPFADVGRRRPLPLALPLPLELPFPFRPELGPCFVPPEPEDRVFSVAAASMAASAEAGRRVLPFEPPDPPGRGPALAGAEPEALGLGSDRSLLSTTGVLGPAFAPSAEGGGGPATMPLRNKISWVRILIPLETMK
jgi:hypothetical protein